MLCIFYHKKVKNLSLKLKIIYIRILAPLEAGEQKQVSET